jgi:hypothetical protein
MRGTQGNRVESLEAREDTTEAFESAEDTFDLLALLVNGMIVVPGMQGLDFGGTTGIIPRSSTNLPGFVAFVSAIHQQRKALRHGSEFFQQRPFRAADRSRDQAKEQKLQPFEHPRQPYESWYSIRRGICRWPAVRFF